MKGFFIKLSIIFSTIIIIFLPYYIHSYVDLKDQVWELNKTNGLMSYYNNLLRENLSSSFYYSGYSLVHNVFAREYTGEIFSIKKIDPEDKIFFYFENSHCTTCVEKELQFIKRLPDQYKTNIVILTHQPSFRQYKILNQKHDFSTIGLEAYFLEKSLINSLEDDLNHPLLFTLDTQHKIQSVLTAKKEFPELSILFYDHFLFHK